MQTQSSTLEQKSGRLPAVVLPFPENGVVTRLEHAGDHKLERLSQLLKRCRTRIPPEHRSLGPYLRLTMRIGKAVTQEEVAEALGISREWYGSMERDRAGCVSAALLARIADALMMAPSERATLFKLAVPELHSTTLTDRSTAILSVFGSLRRITRRLLAATTEAEALTVAREHAMTQFAPAATVTCTRVEQGRWEYAGTGDSYDGASLSAYEALIRQRWGSTAIDDLHCYTIMTQPGELLTRSERDARLPDLAAKRRQALDALGLADVSFAMANVQTQYGFVARLAVVHSAAHQYSEIEREQLSTLAELTSLALAGSVSSLSA